MTDRLKERDLRRGILETVRDGSLPSPYAKVTDKIASYAKMVDISVDTSCCAEFYYAKLTDKSGSYANLRDILANAIALGEENGYLFHADR
ncbi:hypothetical protein WGT02_28340 (plasmid) [Rhizobium sp. T1470]|uniref:hypothetical protein n=1 Tax=Rhizobium sp. T1470 TaxID=555320 RepID=UPI001AAF4C97|nr:hypothetical protein [Rhizobium sp. T1473]MCA0805173.1 hypothetical protein [Rhizobium sp. T1473]